MTTHVIDNNLRLYRYILFEGRVTAVYMLDDYAGFFIAADFLGLQWLDRTWALETAHLGPLDVCLLTGKKEIATVNF